MLLAITTAWHYLVGTKRKHKQLVPQTILTKHVSSSFCTGTFSQKANLPVISFFVCPILLPCFQMADRNVTDSISTQESGKTDQPVPISDSPVVQKEQVKDKGLSVYQGRIEETVRI